MIGDIILDKLRLLYVKKGLSKEERETSSNELKKHFFDSQISNKTGYILNTINPAKLISSKKDNDCMHNLEIASQKKLARALEEVYPKEIRENIWSSILHLAKNTILKHPVADYIKMLGKIDNPYINSETVESSVCKSLYLHFCSENTTHFKIKFYDKGKEYCKRHESPICKLNEPLTDKEIKLLGSAYNSKTNSIDMSAVNMLRIEIELIQKDKLFPVIKKLDKKGESLTLPLILKYLNSGEFYEVLNEIFNEKLLKYVFVADGDFEEIMKKKKLSTITKEAYKLHLKDDNPKYFGALMNELGYGEKMAVMNRTIRKITPDSELYKELYDALFTDDRDETSLVLFSIIERQKKKHFCVSCCKINTLC